MILVVRYKTENLEKIKKSLASTNFREWKLTKLVFLIVLFAATNAFADTSEKQCNMVRCEAGSKVKSYANQSEPYYACQTKELSEYTNYVLGLVITSQLLSGRMPNISPETGDPEQQGQSKAILDMLRAQAKVKTFDQALASCEKGRNGIIFLVANNPADSQSIWVFDSKRKLNYWVPKSAMDKQ